MPDTDPRITKRRVTMTRFSVAIDADNEPSVRRLQAIDYVRPDILDAYLTAAEIAGWETIEVSEEPDAGPGGFDGATYVPEALDHPLAGETFAATTPED